MNHKDALAQLRSMPPIIPPIAPEPGANLVGAGVVQVVQDVQGLLPGLPGSRRLAAGCVNGHCEIRVGGLVFSGLAATSFPLLNYGWR